MFEAIQYINLEVLNHVLTVTGTIASISVATIAAAFLGRGL